jgi:hypothetical protein
MVSADHEWVFGTLEVATPLFECPDNTEELLLTSVVVHFSFAELSGDVGTGPAFLYENGTNAFTAAICLNDKSFVRIWDC